MRTREEIAHELETLKAELAARIAAPDAADVVALKAALVDDLALARRIRRTLDEACERHTQEVTNETHR